MSNLKLVYDDELAGIFEDVAKVRRCYPLTHQIELEFMKYLLTHHRNYLVPIAEQFYHDCIENMELTA